MRWGGAGLGPAPGARVDKCTQPPSPEARFVHLSTRDPSLYGLLPFFRIKVLTGAAIAASHVTWVSALLPGKTAGCPKVRFGYHCVRDTGSSAAWLARSVRDAEAAGSNPAFPTRSEGLWVALGAFYPAFIPRNRLGGIGQEVS